MQLLTVKGRRGKRLGAVGIDFSNPNDPTHASSPINRLHTKADGRGGRLLHNSSPRSAGPRVIFDLLHTFRCELTLFTRWNPSLFPRLSCPTTPPTSPFTGTPSAPMAAAVGTGHYATLNLPVTATPRDVVVRYRELAKALHPDKHVTVSAEIGPAHSQPHTLATPTGKPRGAGPQCHSSLTYIIGVCGAVRLR